MTKSLKRNSLTNFKNAKMRTIPKREFLAHQPTKLTKRKN
jgi:hypothetical protein